jgi:hypothetical protein
VWVVVWTVLTLGVYGAYWWYQVNREMRDLGRVDARPGLGDSPGTSLLAVTLGALLIVPPFVSLYRGCQRVQAAQEVAEIAERERLNGWIALLVLVVGFIVAFIPLIVAFVQSELNKVWRSPGILDDAPGELAPAVQVPPVAPPGEAGVAATPATPAPGAAQPAPGADPELDRLERLAALRDSGAISPTEYEEQKAKILAEL